LDAQMTSQRPSFSTISGDFQPFFQVNSGWWFQIFQLFSILPGVLLWWSSLTFISLGCWVFLRVPPNLEV
jgi:hypothetical protein